MEVLIHHIYEYKKGLRNLVLHTMPQASLDEAERRLRQQNIAYMVQPLSRSQVNIFFGCPECLGVINRIGLKPLYRYTPEEDFILGIMLGYDRRQQCERFLRQKSRCAGDARRAG
ncbi:MAG: DUF2023 family protein [Bacteroidales bacterium]|nr:DUF2023 family protein [Bacteroidales bacterium]